jgi:3-dehydroquinate dehydratase type I
VLIGSLGTWPFELTDAALAGIDAVELRLDLMGVPLADLPEVAGLVATRAPRIIATCRPGGMRERDRVALLVEAVRLGVWAVDIEIDAPAASRAAVVSAARARGSQVIVSHHDFECTPSRRVLQRIVRRSLAAGADLVKIACRVRVLADNATLLGLLDDQAATGRVAVLGMGPLGRVSRAVAPLVGSPLAYVAFGPGLETADGQMTREALLAVWSEFEGRP